VLWFTRCTPCLAGELSGAVHPHCYLPKSARKSDLDLQFKGSVWAAQAPLDASHTVRRRSSGSLMTICPVDPPPRSNGPK
jgi:hypothetical protein